MVGIGESSVKRDHASAGWHPFMKKWTPAFAGVTELKQGGTRLRLGDVAALG